ncbi:MAG: TAT-variant-translocated molybdopterin oxidoreductase [bacterium]|nr:TAT-variant-translocated molybdopterin oxidoreductase [bacterium]
MSAYSLEPGSGSPYWRSLQELADTDDFRNQMEHEFPGGIEAPDGMSRRRFLQIMSASIAMTSLAGCRWPVEKIVPYVANTPGIEPGTPVRFATTMQMGATATPVLATSYDGRPIKIDGNPGHALSGGAASVFAQASVLDLYDPDRSQLVKRRGGLFGTDSDWAAFLAWAQPRFAANLQGTAILTGATSSPATASLLRQAAARGARIYMHEPVCRLNEMRGLKLAYGTAAMTQLDLGAADIIVDFDANCLQDHPTSLRNVKAFAAGRRAESGHMNRLYSYESTFSITGGMADHRYPTAARDLGPAVWALAAELVLGEHLELPLGAGVSAAQLASWRGHAAGGPDVAHLAHDLMAHRGRSLLVTGLRQDPDVHALVHVLNAALGNVGHSVSYVPFELPSFGMVDELVSDLNGGRVSTLVLVGGNPAYDAPADLNFAAAMTRANERIHLGLHDDATGQASTWHLPAAHYLEGWGLAQGWDGSLLAVQPLINPLYAGHTADELLSVLVDPTPRTGHQVARDVFFTLGGGQAPAPAPEADPLFEKKWRAFLHEGFLAGSTQAGVALAFTGATLTAPATGGALSADNLEITFLQDQSVYDGRFADNAWLQEMPDFMTKLTWDNAAVISPAASKELGIVHGDLVELQYKGRSLEAAVYVLPGQARHSVAITLGYGRDDAGRVGQNAGFNAYKLRTWDGLHRGEGLKLRKTGKQYRLATTQDHHAIDKVGAAEIQKRVPGLVREGTFEQYTNEPEFVDHLGIHSPPLISLWKEWEYTGHKWGMAIDLNTCTGCNACVLGCQSENNIPVVGKDQVARGREMAWVRLDRYFLGDVDDPKCAQQPVGCVQCEMAPCEQVCPVAATTHTREGLNAMVYNRCVGTRYCSNNCPYKVRRFNWYNNFEDLTETQRLVLNPDVTVRARGVMEKCTYCVQRIEGARITARVEGRPMRDGDITPACAQTCPTDAIVFGDLNDKDSRVSKLRELSRSYDLLDYLNVKPRTFYLARLRNPNPAIAGSGAAGGHGAPAGHGGHGAGQAEKAHG